MYRYFSDEPLQTITLLFKLNNCHNSFYVSFSVCHLLIGIVVQSMQLWQTQTFQWSCFFKKKELDFSNLKDEYLTTDARCPGARYCGHGLGKMSIFLLTWRAETDLFLMFLDKFNPISFVSLSRPIFPNYLIPNLHYFMKMRVIHTCCHSQVRLRIRPVYTSDGSGTY